MEEEIIRSRQVVQTEDGTSTLKLLYFDEQFHSIHGALTESMHVYIHNGLLALNGKKEINILEVGFGTGLNAILTLIHSAGLKVRYHAVEAYPLLPSEIELLNYPAYLDPRYHASFLQMHSAPHNRYIDDDFYFEKSLEKIGEIDLRDNYYDLVYFDAFSPALQPELWTKEMFKKMYRAMSENAILVTYCAKGSVKRTLKAAQFELESLPGPPGKREISRCKKIIN